MTIDPKEIRRPKVQAEIKKHEDPDVRDRERRTRLRVGESLSLEEIKKAEERA